MTTPANADLIANLRAKLVQDDTSDPVVLYMTGSTVLVLCDRLEAAERAYADVAAERDRLRAQVERVEAICARVEGSAKIARLEGRSIRSSVALVEIRAALAGGAETEPNRRCICDGAAYAPNQRTPFLIHPDCPIHVHVETDPEAPEQSAPVEPRERDVVDLVAVLRASVEAAKKRREEAAQKAARGSGVDR